MPKKLKYAVGLARLGDLEAHFNKRPKKYDFWELFRLFEDRALSLKDIGDKLGVSRERARQIYEKWFREIFPSRHTERHIPRPRVLQGKAKVVRTHLRSLQAGLMAPRELLVQPVENKNGGFSQKAVRITNGRQSFLCLCAVLSGKWTYGSSTLYGRPEINRAEAEGYDYLLIYHTGAETGPVCFVFPISYVLGRTPASRRHISLYLPLRKHKFCTSPNYKYREAWHLIAGELRKEASR